MGEIKIQKIKRNRLGRFSQFFSSFFSCYVLFEEMIGDNSFEFRMFNVFKICF